MHLPKHELEEINKQLRDKYGLFESERPIWRVSLCDGERELRRGEFEDRTPEGLFIRRNLEVREVEKYPFFKGFYILERYMDLTKYRGNELIAKIGYEGIWRFMGPIGEPLPPKFSVCYYVIETIYQGENHARGIKYEHPYADTKIQADVLKKELDEIQEYLFANETPTGDALAYGRGVVVPHNFESTKH